MHNIKLVSSFIAHTANTDRLYERILSKCILYFSILVCLCVLVHTPNTVFFTSLRKTLKIKNSLGRFSPVQYKLKVG